MRPRRVLAVALVSLLTLPSAVSAQNAILPFIGGGLARGIGELGDDTGNGWTVVGGFDIPMDAVAPGFAVGLAGTFANIPYSSDLGDFGEASQVTAVSLEAVYNFGEATSSMRPFVRGGGGLNVRRYDPGEIDTSPNTVIQPGFSAGAGATFVASSVDFIVGARFTTAPDGGFLALFGGVAVPLP
jgi:hypothetical protein